jgi:hypothetical protein
MVKEPKVSKAGVEVDAVKTEERCSLCFKPIINGEHEGGICNYERLKEILKKGGGIIVMA